MEVDNQLKFKSHERMQVEFISKTVYVMTHDCLCSVALALLDLNACTCLLFCMYTYLHFGFFEKTTQGTALDCSVRELQLTAQLENCSSLLSQRTAVDCSVMPGPHQTYSHVSSRLRLSIMMNGHLSKQATLHFCKPNDCLSKQNVNNAVNATNAPI